MITLGIGELVSIGGLLLAALGLFLRYAPRWAERMRQEGRDEKDDENLKKLVADLKDEVVEFKTQLTKGLSGINSRLDEGDERMGRLEHDVKTLIGHTGLRTTSNRPNGGHS